MELTLLTWNIPGNCSLGMLYRDGEPWLASIEREWEDNTPYISCIPEGAYKLIPHESPKYGLAYHLVSEEQGVGIYEGQRTHCLFHPANVAREVQGCVALGTQYLRGQYGVASSRKAVAEFNEALGLKEGKVHDLNIIREGVGHG